LAATHDGTRSAAEVVAKGRGVVAAAIKRTAQEARVPIVHNAPLARTLYAQVELGAMIPEELFTAVAEGLAFVYPTARRRPLKDRARRPPTPPPAAPPAA